MHVATLVKEFENNEVRANQLYIGKRLRIFGTVDSIALWFKSIGHEAWFSYYLTAVIGASLVVYVTMRDTKADSAMERHV